MEVGWDSFSHYTKCGEWKLNTEQIIWKWEHITIGEMYVRAKASHDFCNEVLKYQIIKLRERPKILYDIFKFCNWGCGLLIADNILKTLIFWISNSIST